MGKFACRTSGNHGPAIAFSTNGDTLAVMGKTITLLDTTEADDGKLVAKTTQTQSVLS